MKIETLFFGYRVFSSGTLPVRTSNFPLLFPAKFVLLSCFIFFLKITNSFFSLHISGLN